VGRLDFANTEPAEPLPTKRLRNLDTRLVGVLGLELDHEAVHAPGIGTDAAVMLSPDRDRSVGQDGPLLGREPAVDADQPSPHGACIATEAPRLEPQAYGLSELSMPGIPTRSRPWGCGSRRRKFDDGARRFARAAVSRMRGWRLARWEARERKRDEQS
jgi:hypothetical protein